MGYETCHPKTKGPSTPKDGKKVKSKNHSPILITSCSALNTACQKLSKAESLAIDTEYVAEGRYYPRLELIQITGGSQIYLIDVQAVQKLKPLSRLLRNKATKIFHACEEDLKILAQNEMKIGGDVFDTQVAASLVGYPKHTALKRLVNELVGVELGPCQGGSNWSARPFKKQQLKYAAGDVQYLHSLHKVLSAKLDKRQRIKWYKQEQKALLNKIYNPKKLTAEDLMKRVSNWGTVGDDGRRLIQELVLWRERKAKKLNLPRIRFCSDKCLVALAIYKPLSLKDAQIGRRINKGFYKRYEKEIVSIIKRVAKLPKQSKKQLPSKQEVIEPTPTGLVEICSAFLCIEAKKQSIQAAVIADKKDVRALVSNMKDRKKLSQCRLMSGWRYKVFGKKILRFLAGELSIRVAKGGQVSIKAAC